MAKKKFYVVWQGAKPGIYENWKDCQAQIVGFPGAKFKSFPTETAAKAAFYNGKPTDFIGKTAKKTVIPDSAKKGVVWESISVDAACSGNPGLMEYQGVHTKTGEQYFHQKFKVGTNNIGEFLALVHVLAMLKKMNKNTPIYTDSKIAMGWVRAKKCKTKLTKDTQTASLFEVVKRAEIWLHNNAFTNPILKWETKKWGEIPADFGRK
ncbi:MAG: ribonuclease H family protein [Bacteroidota bacterium]